MRFWCHEAASFYSTLGAYIFMLVIPIVYTSRGQLSLQQLRHTRHYNAANYYHLSSVESQPRITLYKIPQLAPTPKKKEHHCMYNSQEKDRTKLHGG